MEENYQLAKWLNDEMDEATLDAFKKRSDYALLEKIKQQTSTLGTPPFDEAKLWAKIKENKQEPKAGKVFKLNTKWALSVAAILLLSVGLFFIYQNKFITVSSDSKNQLTLKLPDESDVILQEKTSITYHEWFLNREVLLDGTAFFKVSKGSKFEVKTNNGTVEVLGTEFEVSNHNNRFKVTCFEGKVKASIKTNEQILTQGDVVVFENEKIIQTTTRKNQPEWILNSNNLVFKNQSLANVLNAIEKHFNTSIQINNIQSEQMFTGELPKDNLSVSLTIIAKTYHLKVVKKDETHYEIQKE